MCFIQQPAQAQRDDPGRLAQAEQNAEVARRRRAQGYGATLLTSPDTLGGAPLGRRTLGGQ